MTEKDTTRVLFVCTGNIFRSVSAEYYLNEYAEKNNLDIKARSAGIIAEPEPMHPGTVKALRRHGIEPDHEQRKINRQMLVENDVVICMAENHQQYIKEHYNVDTPLFKEVAGEEAVGVKDFGPDTIDPFGEEGKATPESFDFIDEVEEIIFSRIPQIAENLSTYTLELPVSYTRFVDLLNGGTHRNGAPFDPVYDSEHVAAFPSLDVIDGNLGHILVIPKRHVVNLNHLKRGERDEFLRVVQHIGRHVQDICGGYNVLINTEYVGDQTIWHLHAHVIPRTERGQYEMEGWPRVEEFDLEYFKRVTDKLKQIM